MTLSVWHNIHSYFSGQICSARHSDSNIENAVSGELSSGNRVSEVGIIIIGTAFLGADLVPQLLCIEGKCLT